jgi:hypothetical protein
LLCAKLAAKTGSTATAESVRGIQTAKGRFGGPFLSRLDNSEICLFRSNSGFAPVGQTKCLVFLACGRTARVANDVLPEHVRDILHVAPVLRVAVLQPEDARRDVGRHVLDVLGVHGLFAALQA